jgi:hypothetical protein
LSCGDVGPPHEISGNRPPRPAEKALDDECGAGGRTPDAFIFVVIYALAWFIFYRATFDGNAVATLGVFIMTLFIQREPLRSGPEIKRL